MNKGDFLGLVGESGSGKSVTALSIMRLVPDPGKIVEGKILFGGQNLVDLSESQLQRIRGGKVAISFQDPMTYLNPAQRVGDQITEAILLHHDMDRQKAMERAIATMQKLRISDAATRVRDFPHQMSGGMRQRCLLAIALACNPEILIADEPTTSVDVITQSAILRLLQDVKRELGLSMILITHNIAIVAAFAQKIAIMYAGEIMEMGDVRVIFHKPGHPYTRALFDAIPRLDKEMDRLVPIEGTMCDPLAPPPGCKFYARCKYGKDFCNYEKPQFREVEPGHFVSCLRYEEIT